MFARFDGVARGELPLGLGGRKLMVSRIIPLIVLLVGCRAELPGGARQAAMALPATMPTITRLATI